MKPPLSNQIALSLRRRPLVLPMLLATVCVDAVLVQRRLNGGDPLASSLTFHFAMLAQTGLLALWTASSSQAWGQRLALSSAAIALFSLEPGMTVSPDTLGTHCVYYASVLAAQLVGMLIAQLRRDGGRGIRFRTLHLLIAMTVTGGVGATLKLTRPISRTAVDDLLFIAALHTCLVALVFLCRAIIRRVGGAPWGNAAAVVLCLMTAGALGATPSLAVGRSAGDLFLQAFLLVGLILSGWLVAIGVRPDARRRLAARRKRRRSRQAERPAQLSVVTPPEEPLAQVFDVNG